MVKRVLSLVWQECLSVLSPKHKLQKPGYRCISYGLKLSKSLNPPSSSSTTHCIILLYQQLYMQVYSGYSFSIHTTCTCIQLFWYLHVHVHCVGTKIGIFSVQLCTYTCSSMRIYQTCIFPITAHLPAPLQTSTTSLSNWNNCVLVARLAICMCTALHTVTYPVCYIHLTLMYSVWYCV